MESWLSILEASYILFRLPPHFKNFKKRIVKTPRLYFYDVGLASYLLGLKSSQHVETYPHKGFLFENLVIVEKMKECLNRAEKPNLYYFRDNSGNEIDLLEDLGNEVISYEIKYGKTLTKDFFKGLDFYKKLNPDNKKSFLIYNGTEKTVRYGHQCLPFQAPKWE